MLSPPEGKVWPAIIDNDAGLITATVEGVEVRAWFYKSDAERRTKMLIAHDFAEGWFLATQRANNAKPA